MKALIQRVSHANVVVDDQTIGSIQSGLLVFLGVEKGDDEVALDKLLHKLLNYRVFPDNSGRMNLSVEAVAGSLLIVSQFTLAADTKKGLRPSFSSSAEPTLAKSLYLDFVAKVKRSELLTDVQTGEFGADMQVSLCNDGPVTFLLQS